MVAASAQSFIGAYTLHEYLYDNPKALSYEEMVQVGLSGRLMAGVFPAIAT